MKKVLTLLLILVMSLAMLTSCFGEEWNNRNQGGTADAALTAAADFLYNVMKDKEGAENVNDFDVVKKLVVDGVTYEVTWTTDSDKVKIVESSKASYWTVDIPTTNDTAFSYKLTATIKNADGKTITKEFNRKVPVIGADNALVVSDPQEGVDYKLFIVQHTARKVLFLKGATQNNENKYILGGDAKDGAIFRVEKAEGGIKIYTEIDGTKQYINAHIQLLEDGKTSKYLGFSAEKPTVFYYKQNVGAWFTMIDNAEYVIGTYSNFETASLSEGKFMTEEAVANKEQFAISFMTKENADTYTPPVFEVPDEPADGSTMTIKEANEFGKTFSKNGYSSGKFVVSGTVKEIQNPTYGNVVITDGTDEILVYGMYDPAGKRFDKMATQPKVGDVITVKGVIGMYNAPQLKDATLLKINDTELSGGTADSDGLVLNMMGSTTRTEHSSNKTVHSANGVTYVNEKASSTTNNYDQTSNYAARAYKGSVITISADKAFMRVVFVLDDFSDGKYLTGFDGMTVAGATITRDGDQVTVVLAAAAKSITFGELLGQVRIESITVYETAGTQGGGSGSGETVDKGTSLDMKGTTTRTEHSSDKTVHSASGVTYVNEKNTSTTDNYDQTSNYAARAYAGSVITISADKAFMRVVFVLDDFSDGKYLEGFDGMTVAGATITRDGDKVTVVLAEAAKSITFAPLAKQVRIESITVYETAGTQGGGSGSEKPDEGETGMTLVTAPQVGVGYYLRLEQKNLGKILYLNGETANQAWYLASVEDPANAVLVYLEAVSGVDGAYRLYFDKAGTKTYIRVYERDAAGKSGSLELVTAAPEEYFTFNTELNTLMYTKGDNSYILNTYNSFDTFCVSHISKAPLNYVSGLYLYVEEKPGEPEPPHEHDYKATVVDPTCTEAGYTEHKCECGDSYKDAYKDALGHKDENGDKVCDGCGIDREIYNVVDAPVAGIPYFFGLAQEKLGYNLYFNGKTGSKDYYLATEKSAVTAGIRVFLEDAKVAEGTYRLYFETEDGGKIYIRVYERDAENKKGSLELVTNVPNEYFTYDETLKTLVYTAGENAYYIGTYGSFDTLSVSHVSFAETSYVTHFYALNVTGHHSYTAQKVVDPTCTAKGYTVYVCACGDSYKADYTDMIPHVDHNDDKFCDVCQADVRIYEVLIGAPEVGVAYYLGIFQGNLDKVLYFNGKTANKAYYLGTLEIPLEATKIYLEEVNELGRRIYFYDAEGVKTYIRIYERDAAKKSGSLELTTERPVEYLVYDEQLATLVYKAPSGNAYYVGTYSTFDTLSVSHADYATKDGSFVARLYTISAVPHEHLDIVTTVAPQCLEQGYDLHSCPCGYSYKDNFTAALGHIDANADKACDDCEAAMSVSVDMMGTTTRTEYSKEQLKHAANGVTVVVDKAESSTDCYNNTSSYAARFYKGMVVTVSGTALIDKIVLTLDDYSNGQYLVGFDGMEVNGYAVYREGDKVSIIFLQPAMSFVSAPLPAQARVENIEVVYADRAHEHNYETTVVDVECETDGYTVYACACGNVYHADIVTAPGHLDENGDCLCDGCGTLFTVTVDMKGKTHRTEYSTSQMTYAFGNFSVVVDKANSTTNCYDNTGTYAARLYGGSTITFKFNVNMAKIVLTLDDYDNGAYITALDKVSLDGALYTRDGAVITIYLLEPATSYTTGNLMGQLRINTVEVTPVDPAHAHSFIPEVKAADCKNGGYTAYTCACGATGKTAYTPTSGHFDRDDDVLCDTCGEKMPESVKYTFSDYAAGSQYAANEEHVLDANTTVTTTESHFTSELRIYSSSSHNGYAVIHSERGVGSITVNAGNNVDTLNVYVSDDGVTYTLAGTISVTEKSYKDYTYNFDQKYNYIKLDVAGANQVRIKNMTLGFVLQEN